MKNVILAMLVAAVLGLTGCASQKVVLKDAVAEVVQSCRGKVSLSYSVAPGRGENVHATCENGNVEEVTTTRGSIADPNGFQKSIKRSYW